MYHMYHIMYCILKVSWWNNWSSWLGFSYLKFLWLLISKLIYSSLKKNFFVKTTKNNVCYSRSFIFYFLILIYFELILINFEFILNWFWIDSLGWIIVSQDGWSLLLFITPGWNIFPIFILLCLWLSSGYSDNQKAVD